MMSRKHDTDNQPQTEAREEYRAKQLRKQVNLMQVPIRDMNFDQLMIRLGKLDKRLGMGVGASRERARIAARLEQIDPDQHAEKIKQLRAKIWAN